ncbi:uncharacterized protein LOC141899465 [Tubulanus polymorphus]|uniref:uncharacterized protein LOC141899465 n=1 Tax=Tubulanus polymorphus TaxID=672921 RepID=UPI003DA6BEDF
MGRSRSRSPNRRETRRRSRSRERDRKRDRDVRDRDRDRYNRRSRSRSPVILPRRRSRSRSRDRSEKQNVNTSGPTNPKLLSKPEVSEAEAAEISPEDQEMMKVMGFGGFDTTKGKQVDGNNIYQANLLRKRRYRQYMNRRGGFNRPLDFIA